jgi:hypothetical protein
MLHLCEHFGIRSARAKKELIRTIPPLKIAYDEIVFVPSEEANPQHSKPM